MVLSRMSGHSNRERWFPRLGTITQAGRLA
jgi:hypothetical protein